MEIKTKEELFKIIEEQNQKIASLEERITTQLTSSGQDEEQSEEQVEEQAEMTDEEIDELDKFLND